VANHWKASSCRYGRRSGDWSGDCGRLAAEGADVALCFRSKQGRRDEVFASVQKGGRKAAAFSGCRKVAEGQRFIDERLVSWAASISW